MDQIRQRRDVARRSTPAGGTRRRPALGTLKPPWTLSHQQAMYANQRGPRSSRTRRRPAPASASEARGRHRPPARSALEARKGTVLGLPLPALPAHRPPAPDWLIPRGGAEYVDRQRSMWGYTDVRRGGVAEASGRRRRGHDPGSTTLPVDLDHHSAGGRHPPRPARPARMHLGAASRDSGTAPSGRPLVRRKSSDG
jgi:hypothetical protein